MPTRSHLNALYRYYPRRTRRRPDNPCRLGPLRQPSPFAATAWAIGRQGATAKGGFLAYEWELQGRGVWHLHIVLGMESAIERAWAFEYVKALRELGAQYGPGSASSTRSRCGLRSRRANVSGYLSKYLAKRSQDGTLEVSETVKSAGRTLLNYVSRNLTARSGCTMRALRNSRIVWAWREGRLPDHGLTEWDFIVASCLLDRLPVPMRGP